MRQRISVTDIAYYGDRITVYEDQLMGINEDRTPFYRKAVANYQVKNLVAHRVQEYYLDGKPQKIIGRAVPLRDVFKDIRHVYDFNKVLIARRNAPGHPLKVTGKGMSKFIEAG